jgi:predicted dehydrogenase
MTLGAAVVGTGFIGRIHARSARLAGAELVGIGASDADNGARAASELGAQRVYLTPGDVAADPDVDVVHVCTPNALHLPYVRAALAVGKHVICEKPLGIDLGEARTLRGLAQAAGVVATVPFGYRFYPSVREARAQVAAGSLGRIGLVHGSYLQDWLTGAAAANWHLDPALGGRSRAFADIGSHWCDLVEFVTGDRILSVCAMLSGGPGQLAGSGPNLPTDPAWRGESTASVMFLFESGALGSAVVSQVSPGRKNRLWVQFDGSDASAAFDQEHPDSLWMGRRQASTVLPRGETGQSAGAAAVNIVPPGHPQGFTDCFALFVEQTYAAIGGRAPDGLPTFDDGARAAAIVDAVLRSAESGGFVDVDTNSPRSM